MQRYRLSYIWKRQWTCSATCDWHICHTVRKDQWEFAPKTCYVGNPSEKKVVTLGVKKTKNLHIDALSKSNQKKKEFWKIVLCTWIWSKTEVPSKNILVSFVSPKKQNSDLSLIKNLSLNFSQNPLFQWLLFQGISPQNMAKNVVLTYQPMNLDPGQFVFWLFQPSNPAPTSTASGTPKVSATS